MAGLSGLATQAGSPACEPQSRDKHGQRRLVPRGAEPGRGADMLALGRTLPVNAPAARASLARLVLAGVQNNQLAPSLLRFGGEHLQQEPRSGAQDGAVQPGLLPDVPARLLDRTPGRGGHVPDREFLGHDQPVHPADAIEPWRLSALG